MLHLLLENDKFSNIQYFIHLINTLPVINFNSFQKKSILGFIYQFTVISYLFCNLFLPIQLQKVLYKTADMMLKAF